MLSINDISSFVNDKVCGIIPGAKAYGIAKSATKDGNLMPYIDEKYIGIDDTYPAMMYHKLLSVASTTVPVSGYGDNEQSLQNTYQMAMIVYFSEGKCEFSADKLYTFIQASISGKIKSADYKSVRVGVTSASLNDSQVWAQEYGQAPFKLIGPQRLIQVNYSVVMVYNKECITIPQCKN